MKKDRYCRVKLLERIDFTDELAVFRFRPEEPLSFTPGQYATLAVEVDGQDRPLQRPYSVASAPHESTLDFFVERVEGGSLTERLWDLDPEARCWVRRRIVGLFVLDRESGRDGHVMAATVTGVGPYVSIIRSIQHELAAGQRAAPPQMLVVHGGSKSQELGFYREELTEASREGWLTYVPTISRPWADPGWTGELGRVEDVIRKHMDTHGFHADNSVVYACGHPGMIEKVRGISRRAGFSDEHFNEEKYFREPSKAAASA